MSDQSLEERLAAVERALTDGDESAPDPAVPDDLPERVETLEADVAELEAAVQAVRGYVGSVKHVNDEVEQRADAAMAKAEALERALAGGPREDAPLTDGADGADPVAPGSNGDTCPRCGHLSQETGPVPGDRGGGTGVDSTERVTEAITGRGPDRTDDRCDRRSGDGNDRPGVATAHEDTYGAATSNGHESGGPDARLDLTDRDAPLGPADPDEPSDSRDLDAPSDSTEPHRSSRNRTEGGASHGAPSGDRIGHRCLEAPDEADGLLARLREVL